MVSKDMDAAGIASVWLCLCVHVHVRGCTPWNLGPVPVGKVWKHNPKLHTAAVLEPHHKVHLVLYINGAASFASMFEKIKSPATQLEFGSNGSAKWPIRNPKFPKLGIVQNPQQFLFISWSQGLMLSLIQSLLWYPAAWVVFQSVLIWRRMALLL